MGGEVATLPPQCESVTGRQERGTRESVHLGQVEWQGGTAG